MNDDDEDVSLDESCSHQRCCCAQQQQLWLSGSALARYDSHALLVPVVVALLIGRSLCEYSLLRTYG